MEQDARRPGNRAGHQQATRPSLTIRSARRRCRRENTSIRKNRLASRWKRRRERVRAYQGQWLRLGRAGHLSRRRSPVDARSCSTEARSASRSRRHAMLLCPATSTGIPIRLSSTIAAAGRARCRTLLRHQPDHAVRAGAQVFGAAKITHRSGWWKAGRGVAEIIKVRCRPI